MIVVIKDKKIAILAHYKMLNQVNHPYSRLKLQGLDPNAIYHIDQHDYSGAELMQAGFSITDASSGEHNNQSPLPPTYDFDSRIWVIQQK